jgi:hypothetical protein
MITRIRYTKHKTGLGYFSPDIPLNADLTVRICILVGFVFTLLNVKTGNTIYLEQCKSIQSAKRKARKKLEELGLNFNNEIRRKK